MRASKALGNRSTFAALSFVVLASLSAACGGKTPEAKAPEGATPTAPTAATGTAPTTDAPAPPTTTTATLPSSSDPGTKLPAAGAAPSTKADDPPKKGAEPGRGAQDIQAIIVARRDEARACYDEGVKKNPSLEGDLDIKWTIDPEGNVTDAGADDAKSTIHDQGVTSCIVAIIKKVKFAKSPKGFETRTHYPFNFHPKGNQVGKGAGQPPKN